MVGTHALGKAAEEAGPAGSAAPPARPATVLVVDDNSINLKVLSGLLRRDGHGVLLAHAGAEAIEIAIRQLPDLILLDVMMPEMDGFEVIRWLRRDPRTADIPVIYLSALNTTDDKVQGLTLGAVDYVSKPFDLAEVGARVRTQLKLRQLTRELAEANQGLRDRERVLDEDLRAAAGIQRCLIPKAPPAVDQVDFAWRFMPCERSGGDVFDAAVLDDEHVALYVVDVSGHGVSAAMVTVSVAQSLLAEHRLGTARDGNRVITAPADVLRQLDAAYPIERFDRHFTILYGILDHRRGRFSYSCAGHPPGLLVGRSGRVRRLAAGGSIIGLGSSIPFEQETVELDPGDRLFLYTDGIVEYEDAAGEFFGEERLQQCLADTSLLSLDGACSAVLAALRRFAGEVEATDDITLLACEYRGPSTPAC